MKYGPLLPLGLLALCCGCSIPLQDPEAMVLNRCAEASDCGSGAVCTQVDGHDGQKQCVATKADLSGLVLEVRPGTPPQLDPSKQASIKDGVSYLIDAAADGITLSGLVSEGFAVTHDIDLPRAAQITEGRVSLNADALDPKPCPGVTGTINADVTFRRASRYAGLPAAEYTAAHSESTDDYLFSATLPPDSYDVYVTPRTPENCVDMMKELLPSPPPYFISHLEIAGDKMLNVTLPPLQKLTGDLEVPLKLDINDWTLALVEPGSGLQISAIQTIVQPDLTSTKINTYPPDAPPALQGLDFNWSPETGGRPIIRLRAPGQSLTSVHWPLVNADVNGDNEVHLKLAALDTLPVKVKAVVLDESNNPVASTVSIQADGSQTADAKNVSLKLIVETDEEGRFEAEVFPASATEAGSYKVSARPKVDEAAAIGETTWKISESDLECGFCGQSIQLPPKTSLHASVTTPTGEPLRQVAANADPSLQKSANYFENAVATTLTPRSAVGVVESGVLAMALDAGAYDLSIQPEASSGYPWLVLPRVTVLADTDVKNLDPLQVSFPVVLEGVLRDADGKPQAGAVVRAWLPIDTVVDPGESATVIQIAETVSDADGHYVLLLPPSVTQSVSP